MSADSADVSYETPSAEELKGGAASNSVLPLACAGQRRTNFTRRVTCL